MALFASFLPLEDPARSAFRPRLGMFSDGNIFGTDTNGRDVLARVVHGTRVSVLIGFASVSIGMVVGGALGLYAGYFRNRLASTISWLFDILLSFPAIVLRPEQHTSELQSLMRISYAVFRLKKKQKT